ncbi:SGNH/GDSL hydrolase family protein [Nocardia vaccinii]|uniref:SGNH/GDSL hydrolase family protein n=1 Tax=Nocardia vaccinii TaxID=1822 RepID=UPI000A007C0D|nr:GDSL-type esterase/lipase family protein [Nocardia vaccinii]
MPIRVACAGDSLTKADVSADYLAILRQRFAGEGYVFTNHGVNADHAYNLRMRLAPIIAEQPDFVTVLIGTNDARVTLSDKDLRAAIKAKQLPRKPTPQWYRESLTAVVDILQQQTDADIAVLSLPTMGEELGSAPVARAGEYSAIACDVAAAAGVAYLPLYEHQLEYLRAQRRTPGMRFQTGRRPSATAAIQHFVLRRSFDAISARRGLQLTTDGIHQNTRGATMIADLITEHLRPADDDGCDAGLVTDISSPALHPTFRVQSARRSVVHGR